MDDNLKRQHIASLRLYAQNLAEDSSASIPEKLLRPLLTEQEFANYKAELKSLASCWTEPTVLPKEAAYYWDHCKKIIKICNLTRTRAGEKAASMLAEKAQEKFEEVPEDQQDLFFEMDGEDWLTAYPKVEFLLPLPRNQTRRHPFAGTSKNAAQKDAIKTALNRLTDAPKEGAEPSSEPQMLRPGLLRGISD